jgi:hypothetical protein
MDGMLHGEAIIPERDLRNERSFVLSSGSSMGAALEEASSV